MALNVAIWAQNGLKWLKLHLTGGSVGNQFGSFLFQNHSGPPKKCFWRKNFFEKIFFPGPRAAKKIFFRPGPGARPGGRGAQSGPKRCIQGSGTCLNDPATSKTSIIQYKKLLSSPRYARNTVLGRFWAILRHFGLGRLVGRVKVTKMKISSNSAVKSVFAKFFFQGAQPS